MGIFFTWLALSALVYALFLHKGLHPRIKGLSDGGLKGWAGTAGFLFVFSMISAITASDGGYNADLSSLNATESSSDYGLWVFVCAVTTWALILLGFEALRRDSEKRTAQLKGWEAQRRAEAQAAIRSRIESMATVEDASIYGVEADEPPPPLIPAALEEYVRTTGETTVHLKMHSANHADAGELKVIPLQPPEPQPEQSWVASQVHAAIQHSLSQTAGPVPTPPAAALPPQPAIEHQPMAEPRHAVVHRHEPAEELKVNLQVSSRFGGQSTLGGAATSAAPPPGGAIAAPEPPAASGAITRIEAPPPPPDAAPGALHRAPGPSHFGSSGPVKLQPRIVDSRLAQPGSAPAPDPPGAEQP